MWDDEPGVRLAAEPRRRAPARLRAGWLRAGWSRAGWSRAGWLRAGWLRAGWDVAAGLGLFGIYLLVAALTDTRLPVAAANARDVAAAERWLRLPDERAINLWTAARGVLADLANYHYAVGYLVTTFAAVLWLRLCRPAGYRRHVTLFLAINLVAIGVFAVYPVTPPRLLPGAGFVDTVEAHDTWGSWGSGLVTDVANQHAAVPSLHVAWAAWVAIALVRERVPGWLQRSAVLHVGTTTAVIVMTGNHWILDAAAGLALVGIVEAGRYGGGRLRRIRAVPVAARVLLVRGGSAWLAGRR